VLKSCETEEKMGRGKTHATSMGDGMARIWLDAILTPMFFYLLIELEDFDFIVS
jgi:hypothetical protein